MATDMSEMHLSSTIASTSSSIADSVLNTAMGTNQREQVLVTATGTATEHSHSSTKHDKPEDRGSSGHERRVVDKGLHCAAHILEPSLLSDNHRILLCMHTASNQRQNKHKSRSKEDTEGRGEASRSPLLLLQLLNVSTPLTTDGEAEERAAGLLRNVDVVDVVAEGNEHILHAAILPNLLGMLLRRCNRNDRLARQLQPANNRRCE